jgi:hypothetical protein
VSGLLPEFSNRRVNSSINTDSTQRSPQAQDRLLGDMNPVVHKDDIENFQPDIWCNYVAIKNH